MFDALFPKQIINISRGQRQVIHQLDNLTNMLHEHLVLTRQANAANRNLVLDINTAICPLICLTVASIGYFMLKGLSRGWSKWISPKHVLWGSPMHHRLVKIGRKPTITTDLHAIHSPGFRFHTDVLSCKLQIDSPQRHKRLHQEDYT
jgi:hypothetical protein